MRIRYKPKFGIRIIEPFQWDESNDYVQDVPLELAAQLATYPIPDQFEIAEEDVEAAQAEVDEFIGRLGEEVPAETPTLPSPKSGSTI